jgi:hypothetical protein
MRPAGVAGELVHRAVPTGVEVRERHRAHRRRGNVAFDAPTSRKVGFAGISKPYSRAASARGPRLEVVIGRAISAGLPAVVAVPTSLAEATDWFAPPPF